MHWPIMKMTHHVLNNNYCLRTIHLPFGGFNMDFILFYLFLMEIIKITWELWLQQVVSLPFEMGWKQASRWVSFSSHYSASKSLMGISIPNSVKMVSFILKGRVQAYSNSNNGEVYEIYVLKIFQSLILSH